MIVRECNVQRVQNLKTKNKMNNSIAVSSRTQQEMEKFYEVMRKCGNIYLSNLEKMDRAYNIVRENTEKNIALESFKTRGIS